MLKKLIAFGMVASVVFALSIAVGTIVVTAIALVEEVIK